MRFIPCRTRRATQDERGTMGQTNAFTVGTQHRKPGTRTRLYCSWTTNEEVCTIVRRCPKQGSKLPMHTDHHSRAVTYDTIGQTSRQTTIPELNENEDRRRQLASPTMRRTYTKRIEHPTSKTERKPAPRLRDPGAPSARRDRVRQRHSLHDDQVVTHQTRSPPPALGMPRMHQDHAHKRNRIAHQRNRPTESPRARWGEWNQVPSRHATVEFDNVVRRTTSKSSCYKLGHQPRR